MFYFFSMIFYSFVLSLIYLDLFSGVDYFYFKFQLLQGLFIVFSSVWLGYMFMFNYFFNPSKQYLVSTYLVKVFQGGQSELSHHFKGWFYFMWSFFLLMTFSNLVGLVPYVYGVTTNFYFVLFLSLWGWLTLIFSSMFYNFISFVSHFCPLGAPKLLGWFLSVVEVVSVGIRPGTLTLRLVAKMTTGHMLIGLMTLSSCFLFFKKIFLGVICFVLLLGYIVFEVAICFIQGKVFFMLMQSYTAEHV